MEPQYDLKYTYAHYICAGKGGYSYGMSGPGGYPVQYGSSNGATNTGDPLRFPPSNLILRNSAIDYCLLICNLT